MIDTLQPVLARWEETHLSLVDCLNQFPEDRFLWRPAPRATTAAEIVTHTARAEIHYGCRILDQPREPFEPEVLDRASALAVVEQAAEQARAIFYQLRTEDLDRVIAEVWHPLTARVEGKMTPLWFLEQMNRHKAYHLGQLWYLSLMLES